MAAVTTNESQMPVETVWQSANPNPRASQLPVEAVYQDANPNTRESQMPVEAIYQDDNPIPRESQMAVEILYRGRPQQRTIRTYTFNMNGHSFFVAQLGDQEGTIVYDQTTQQWAEWQSFEDAFPLSPYRVRYAWNWGTDIIGGDNDLGLIWNIDDQYYSDQNPYYFGADLPINAILVGGVPQRLRDSTACNGVQLVFSAGYPVVTFSPTMVKLETSDDQGSTYDDQGTVTLTLDTSQIIDWKSLGSIGEPLRVFRISDNGIARIDGADMW